MYTSVSDSKHRPYSLCSSTSFHRRSPTIDLLTHVFYCMYMSTARRTLNFCADTVAPCLGNSKTSPGVWNYNYQQPYACFNLGDKSQATWAAGTDATRVPYISVKYVGGDSCYNTQPVSQYTIENRFVCDPTQSDGVAVISNVTAGATSCDFVATVKSSAACSKPPAAPVDIVALASNDPSLSTLVGAIQAAGLVSTLRGAGPFTVLAPTNDAFAKLPANIRDYMVRPANIDKLQAVLKYHVISGQVNSSQLRDHTHASSVQGSALDVFVPSVAYDAGTVYFDWAQVTQADLLATNGVVHKIDEVILPPNFELPPNLATLVQSKSELSTLVQLLVAADLLSSLGETFGPLTVFAPTNAAFAKLPPAVINALQLPANKALLTSVIAYHVLPMLAKSTALSDRLQPTTVQGGKVTVYLEYGSAFINYAQVVAVDAEALNGVVHEIDNVLMPAGLLAQLTAAAIRQMGSPLASALQQQVGAAAPTQSIVELAQSVPTLSTLGTICDVFYISP
jgi:transforming growth factor-beta-induced protein